jgi:hypothetical protein
METDLARDGFLETIFLKNIFFLLLDRLVGFNKKFCVLES